MIIHGVDLDFRLYDPGKKNIKEKYFEQLSKMKTVKDDMPDGNEEEQNKYLCDRIKALFDNVFGEGTGEAVCGGGNDLLEHLDAYDHLVSEQMRQQNRYDSIMSRMKNIGKGRKK